VKSFIFFYFTGVRHLKDIFFAFYGKTFSPPALLEAQSTQRNKDFLFVAETPTKRKHSATSLQNV
jgi:hypothetical protein